MKPLHEELRDIRLEKGVSLEDISKVTKIRVHLLEKMEEGNFSAVPLPYTRAFLREYAEVMGMDPDQVIARFDKRTSRIRDIPPSGEKKTSASPENTYKESEVNTDGEPGLTIEKTTESTDEPPQESSDSLQDVDESDTAGKTVSDIQQTDEETPPENPLDFTQTQTHPIPSPESLTKKDDSQTSLFSAIEETVSDVDLDNNTEEEILEEHISPGHPTTRKHLVIEEPKPTNAFFFVLFLVLIIIAAIIIVWLNRSGVF